MSIIGALFKKPKAPDNPLQLSLTTNGPRKLLLGKTGTAGAFVYHGLSNKSRDLTRVFVLAGHRCNGLTRMWADGQQVYSGRLQHGVRTVVTALNSRKKNLPQCWVTWFDGRANQTADSWLRSTYHSPIGWGINDKLQGCSYITVTTRHNEGDIDTVLDWIFEVEGALLYDRRADSTAGGSGSQRWNDPSSWAYTDNAAVAVDHYQLGMVGGANADKLIFGMGLKTWQVPYDEFEANADTCDENVYGVSRYAVNGELSAADDHKDNIVKMAEAMASVPYDTGGRVIIRPQQARAVRLTLTDADLVDSAVAELSESPSGDDIVNTVKGEYREPSARHHSQPYPEQQDAALVSKDGRPFEVSLDLTLENNSSRAQRIANIELEVQKRRDIIRETFMPIANVLSIGDWFTRVSNLRGPVTKTYEVIDKTVNPDLTVQIEARETDPSITAFGENQARPVDLPDPLDPFDPDRPAPPAATGTQDDEEGGGATRPVGVITLDPIDPIDGERYDYFEVEHGISTGGANPTIIAGTERKESFSNEDQSVLTLPNLLPSTTYAWRLRTVSGVLYSDWGPFAEFTTTADFVSTNTQAVGGTPAVAVLSELAAATQGLIDAAQARSDEAQDRLDGDVAEAVARAADLVTEALARAEAIAEVDTRLTAVIAGYLGSEGSGAVATNFADLSIWSRTISTTDKDKFLALLASEALTVDGVPAYATTGKRLLRLTLAKPCTGGQSIPVTARFKALTDGTTSGGTVTGYAYYWNAAGDVRVGFETWADQKITVADGIVTITGTLTAHADAEWYSPYFFINRVTGEDAHIAMLDLLDGDAGGAPIEGSVQAAIAAEAEARANADGALATELATVKATADNAATSAQLTTEATARADADSALSQRVDTVQATADDAATSAQLNTLAQASADADGALATSINTITATLGGLGGLPLNENHNFDVWPVGAATPTGWAQFNDGTITKQVGEDGAHALRMQVATGQVGGFEQTLDIGEKEYKLKVKLKGISSNLNGCGVWVRIRNAANGTLDTHQFLLESHADVDGVTSSSASDYREWSFTIPAQSAAATAWVRFYGHFAASGPANAIEIDRLELVAPTGAEAEVQALALVVAEQGDDIDGVETYLSAYNSVRTSAGGALTEIVSRSLSDGTVSFSDITLTADQIVFEAGGNKVMAVEGNGVTMGKTIRWVGGNTNGTPDVMLVHGLDAYAPNGAGFGAQDDLLEWFGPYSATVDSCTKTNGTRAKTIDGKSYLEGVQEGGTAISASDSTTLGVGSKAEVTSIGANGNLTEATASYLRTGTRNYWTDQNFSSGTFTQGAATIQLARKEGAGAYVLRNTLNMTGTLTRTNEGFDPEFGQYFIKETFRMSGSVLRTQQSSAAQTYDWKTTLTSETGNPTGVGWTFARTTSVSVFEPS